MKPLLLLFGNCNIVTVTLGTDNIIRSTKINFQTLKNGFKQLAFGDSKYTDIVNYVKSILVLVKYN